ncbi:receptor-like protein kinase FERONIA isoform X2 [Pyrus x bretschneideri]|uniref:receptor-like protein kinase FERONIA isoform X1 n=1 Tax=Pyrus x bretschneideri TaxID=225117 RepID=UPI002030B4AC|nr:receptor-like protein kinase FERONIA isoform X1 [Pyrus x bretschneideri]XP_048424449.1 receptor-like protein kinase FERONIA isoform X2 [Pyrus x bretschneideri]
MGLTAQSVSRFFSFRKKKQKDWAFPEELCRRFTLAEISAATQCFDQTLCIGKSAFGTVYKGRIKVDGDEDRKDVAIQRISGGSERRMREFRAEVQLLCQLRHPNLISLIGFCQENGERITVYDYMPNGTLSDYLLDPSNTKNKDPFPLTWKQKLKICIGVARSVHYLHAGVKHAVIHRDVKCFNVLLDQNLVPKLSSFGLSKMGPPALSNALIKMNSNLTGTFGYVDPEYLDSGNVTEKSDVYSFGVVLLEVLCAKSILILSNERPGSGAIFPDLIDPFLKGKVAPDCLKKFMNITVRCLRRTGAERPTMGEVQVELECALELQESADAVKQLKELGTSASTSLAPPLPAYDMEDYTYENISFSEINETFCILVRFI